MHVFELPAFAALATSGGPLESAFEGGRYWGNLDMPQEPCRSVVCGG